MRQSYAQSLHPETDARLDGAQGLAQTVGHLTLCEAAKVGEINDLALLRGQGGQGRQHSAPLIRQFGGQGGIGSVVAGQLSFPLVQRCRLQAVAPPS